MVRFRWFQWWRVEYQMGRSVHSLAYAQSQGMSVIPVQRLASKLYFTRGSSRCIRERWELSFRKIKVRLKFRKWKFDFTSRVTLSHLTFKFFWVISIARVQKLSLLLKQKPVYLGCLCWHGDGRQVQQSGPVHQVCLVTKRPLVSNRKSSPGQFRMLRVPDGGSEGEGFLLWLWQKNRGHQLCWEPVREILHRRRVRRVCRRDTRGKLQCIWANWSISVTLQIFLFFNSSYKRVNYTKINENHTFKR